MNQDLQALKDVTDSLEIVRIYINSQRFVHVLLREESVTELYKPEVMTYRFDNVIEIRLGTKDTTRPTYHAVNILFTRLYNCDRPIIQSPYGTRPALSAGEFSKTSITCHTLSHVQSSLSSIQFAETYILGCEFGFTHPQA